MTQRLLALMAALISGCSGAAPTHPGFPDFYRGWPELTPQLATDLDGARVAALRDAGSGETLIHLARASSRLARHQAQLWLDSPPLEYVEPRLSLHSEAMLRARLISASELALGYYFQSEILGGKLDWRDTAAQAWLLVLLGRDDEARSRLTSALGDAGLPSEARERLSDLRSRLQTVPARR